MDDGRRKPKIKPHEEEDDWDWKKYRHKIQEEEEKDLDFAESYTNIRDMDLENPDILDTQGEEDAETQRKQEQTEGRKDGSEV